MSDEPLYCPMCGLEDCTHMPEDAPPEALVYCELCGFRTGGGTCEACFDHMMSMPPGRPADNDDPFA